MMTSKKVQPAIALILCVPCELTSYERQCRHGFCSSRLKIRVTKPELNDHDRLGEQKLIDVLLDYGEG